MIEIIIEGLYCLVAGYACFRMGLLVRVREAKTLRGKIFRSILLLLLVFGLLMSAALFTEVIIYAIAPGAEFDII